MTVNLPVDLSFTVATTAIADLLANRATTSVTAGAGGNDALVNLTAGALFTLAGLGIALPSGAETFWVTGYNLETDTSAVVQLGYLNAAGSTFIPFDTHVCTTVASGGIVKTQGMSPGFQVPLSTAVRLCLKVSGFGAATAVRVTGEIDLTRAV